MEQSRIFIAIALTFVIFFVWNMFFVEQPPPPKPEAPETPVAETAPAVSPTAPTVTPAPVPAETSPVQVIPAGRPARTITIDTPLYTAQISEQGAVLTSFKLKAYRETAGEDSPLKEMILAEGL